MSNLNRMVRMLGPMPRRLRDSDRDGVPDMMDCQPYNPRKQGIVHDVKAGIQQRLQERRQKAAARRQIRKSAVAEGLRTEREEAIKTARFREQQRAEKRREYIKSGGFFGSVSKGIVSVASGPPRRTRRITRRTTRRAAPRRTRRITRRTTRRAAPRKETMPSLSDFKLFG